jgi:hypothetical protein
MMPPLRRLAATAALAVLLPAALAAAAGEPPGEAKRRVIIETDAGGDPDDEQSLVRFLLYANEWDIEGILCTRPQTLRGENLNPEPTGLDIVRRHLRAYAEVHARLREHGDFPTPEFLTARTVAGYDDRDDGVDLLIAAVDRDDPRPVWFSNWGTNDGTTSSLLRALDRVLRERGPDGYARFKNRLRLCSDDRFGRHTTSVNPPWKLWVYTKFPDIDGGRWYHRFGPLTAEAGGFDLNRDLLTDHGPLAALYPTNTHLRQKEGDTPEFLYLIPNGLNEPEEPGWGSWAGRFGRQPDAGARAYYWASVRDELGGRHHRDHTLLPWAAHLQNDFRARLDWCVRGFKDANHPPVPRVVGGRQRTVRTGTTVTLDATPSTDPDGHQLDMTWRHYPEPGTYRGPALALTGHDQPLATFQAPVVPAPQTLHLILTVTDRGDPPLTRYARVVVAVEP